MTKTTATDAAQVPVDVETLAIALYDAYIDAVNEHAGTVHHAPWYGISGSATNYRDIWRLAAKKLIERGVLRGAR